MRRRIVFFLAAIAVLVAVAMSGSAFGQVPPGAGCEGIVEAIVAQKANPTGEDEQNAELADTLAKAHKCDVGKGS
jgi:hypothetical protein